MAGKATLSGARLVGYREHGAIARGQCLGLARRPAVPDRPDGVDDPAGGEVEAVGHDRLAGRASADVPACRLQAIGPGGSMDGAIDAATAGQIGRR